jgi:hypothetical protein
MACMSGCTKGVVRVTVAIEIEGGVHQLGAVLGCVRPAPQCVHGVGKLTKTHTRTHTPSFSRAGTHRYSGHARSLS